jgi:tRNA nucleotidyltransferase (CCA-adding enzyme)
LDALGILRRASQSQGIPVYLVGGAVRDILLDRPLNDLDLAVEGDVPTVARMAGALAAEIDGHLVMHHRFGTASVTAGGARIDLATARRESYAKPGALPQVTPAPIKEDLARRDFSINALALSLIEDHPLVMDLSGGLEDLRLGLVRVLHPQSFVDDPTRIFRAVRYEQRLSFHIEEETLDRLSAALTDGRIAGLSADRIRHELRRIFQEARPQLSLERAFGLGVLAGVHPALLDLEPVGRLTGVEVEIETEIETQIEADGVSGGQELVELVWLAALAYPLDKNQGQGLVQCLNMPADWQRTVSGTIELRGLEVRLQREGLSGSGLFHLLEGFPEEALRAVSMVSGSAKVKQRLNEYLDHLRHVTGEFDGGDLQAMGVPQGPEIGEILARLRDASLDGTVSTKAGQLKMVYEILAGRDLGVGNG